MKILSIIPARGGSKGIPLKNLALIDGLTLLEYSINSSHDSKLINKTVVSTDNNLIAKEAKRLNAEVITRPKKISNDSAKLEPTIKHTLDYLKKQKSYVPDLIVLLQNTSPLRTGKHIDEAIKILQKGKYDSVFSGYFTKSLFWEKTRSSIFPKNYDPENRPRRQNMKNQIIENGAIVNKFNLTFDDMISFNSSYFRDNINKIYLKELQVKETTENHNGGSCLDFILVTMTNCNINFMINVMILPSRSSTTLILIATFRHAQLMGFMFHVLHLQESALVYLILYIDMICWPKK